METGKIPKSQNNLNKDIPEIRPVTPWGQCNSVWWDGLRFPCCRFPARLNRSKTFLSLNFTANNCSLKGTEGLCFLKSTEKHCVIKHAEGVHVWVTHSSGAVHTLVPLSLGDCRGAHSKPWSTAPTHHWAKGRQEEMQLCSNPGPRQLAAGSLTALETGPDSKQGLNPS